MWSPDSSITGGAITGWTSPVYGLTAVQAKSLNSSRKLVTSVGGSGPTTVHSALLPFFEEFTVPAALKTLPPANPLTGLRGAPPVNVYTLLVGKGGYVASGVPAIATMRVEWRIPAGMETYNPVETGSLVSFGIGLLNEESADIHDTILNGSQ